MSEENKDSAAPETPAPAAEQPAAAEKPAAAAAPAPAAQGLLETLKTNRNAQYALGGAVVVVFLASFMGGGDEVTKVNTAAVAIGQTVTVENPNGGNSQLTLAPGMMGAADPEDTEQNVCLVKGAAKGTIEEEQIAGLLAYVKVKMLEGDCQGKSGWTSKINIKAG
ncbi:hypothetical protein SAMN02949497_2675 [Methylomagnum ishizawai]|uniref:Uncharacterized protein n=1 Tax=Methylomagnum ishizawai TaxID=1760988 RepID=A0A1Y6D5V3_9GAMM|nr:hypothetical protein [Methylomagnum ishizawai]SMF95315.1 hypothetical protein SAMN02949497_2675 [Methylomagnum ishizawai]